MAELKKCPFCGGEATLANIFGRNGVICNECEAMFRMHMGETEQDAIKAWNTRKPIDDIVERLEEKAEQCRNLGFVSEQKGHSELADKCYREMCGFLKAIDIVRNAGKEGGKP